MIAEGVVDVDETEQKEYVMIEMMMPLGREDLEGCTLRDGPCW